MASEKPFCKILLITAVTWPDAMFLNTHLQPLFPVTPGEGAPGKPPGCRQCERVTERSCKELKAVWTQMVALWRLTVYGVHNTGVIGYSVSLHLKNHLQ